MTSGKQQLYLGLDVGTSGIRAVVSDRKGVCIAGAEDRYLTSAQRLSPTSWVSFCLSVLERLSKDVDLKLIAGLAVDGQSGTVLLCDADGKPLSPAKFYHEEPSEDAKDLLAKALGKGAASLPPTLGRVVDLWTMDRPSTFRVTHQADWIAGQFCGRFDFSDENNALKLGYDPAAKEWVFDPACLPFSAQSLPEVRIPASLAGTLSASMASRTGLSATCKVYTGTTDGMAGFLAASGFADLKPGTAVTSLGTTMVLKAVSPCRVDAGSNGVYSHKLFNHWVAGGASNSGGGVLLKYFAPDQLERLSKQIDPTVSSKLDYYPLTKKGERFPISDPARENSTDPRPSCDVAFLAGLLESIARIERQGYDLLSKKGVPYPAQVRTVGGGSKNLVWNRIRERVLGVPVLTARHSEAAYGAALLASLGGRAR
ncbi:FGGY-family carbohydrate kinase [Labrenzia sp. PHM005]|uniref:FGGY-family carbohydrate kinase n=1 Tax=Labrenzia sp. PHM005 TaxID=2590016 RepID=UPI00113FC7FB|nr:FGGY-family carbohydrate kinase [Labrenzia sp. PHM005]QDG78172.1 carbohydrate kinase [Labrenzia sp. PHM005]